MTTVIRTENLTRRFGTLTALDHLCLQVQQGEVFGFLGPNGAGKTTTVRLLNGVLGISEGSAVVLGHDVATQSIEIRRRVGVLTENPSVYDSLTASENLAFVGDVFGIPREKLAERIAWVLAEFGLSQRADDRVATFSKGMRQRLGIARVILHEPELIFLDEPTSGLDPEAAMMVNNLIQQLSHQHGRTVFLCTHNLDEAQRLCDRVGVIEGGRLAALGTPAELAKALWQGFWVDVDLRAEPSPATVEALRRSSFVQDYASRGSILSVRLSNEDAIPALVTTLCSTGSSIFSVMQRQRSLSDIYFRIQDDLRENGAG